MSRPQFEMMGLDGNRWIINDQGRTVATISKQGSVDWLLKRPTDDGPLLTRIEKDNHIGNTMGLRMAVFVPPAVDFNGVPMAPLQWLTEEGGSRLWLRSGSASRDGELTSVTTAQLVTDGLQMEFGRGKKFYVGFFINDSDVPGDAFIHNFIAWPAMYQTFCRTEQMAEATFE